MQWLHRDPTAARSWLASTDVISDADKRIILDPQHFGQTVPAATP
jgi:hypothetical protein